MVLGTDMQTSSLTANIVGGVSLSASIHPVACLVGKVHLPAGYKDYDGEYTITPSIHEQELDTEDRHMIENLVIKEIPFHKTDNIYGGQSVTIGG